MLSVFYLPLHVFNKHIELKSAYKRLMANMNIANEGKETRFTSDNQPKNRGRKPSVYKYIKSITGKKIEPEMSREDYYKVIRFLMESSPEELKRLVKNVDGSPNEKTPVWVLNVVSAINADIRYGRTSTVEMLFDRIFGKATQVIDSEVNASVTNNGIDLSALSTEELLQYNNLLEKMKSGGNGTK